MSTIKLGSPIILIRPLRPIPAKEVIIDIKASRDGPYIHKPLLLISYRIQARVLRDPERPPRAITARKPRLIIPTILIALLVCDAAASRRSPVEREIGATGLRTRDAYLVVQIAFAALAPHAVLDAHHSLDERGGGKYPAAAAAALVLVDLLVVLGLENEGEQCANLDGCQPV
jgi:hypothetical protein